MTRMLLFPGRLRMAKIIGNLKVRRVIIDLYPPNIVNSP